MCCQTMPSPNTLHGKCRWIRKPIYPCTLMPAGENGVLEITSYTKRGPVTAEYTVAICFDTAGREVGYQLKNLDNGQVYDINTEWGLDQWECSCGDCTFRSRLCKHSKALQAALQAINLLKTFPKGNVAAAED